MTESKLTDELIDKLVYYMRRGNYLKYAAAICSVAESDVYYWINKGTKGHPSYDGEASSCIRLAELIKKAEAEAIDEAQYNLKTGVTQWQASATWLERRDRKNYGRSEKIDVNTTNELKIDAKQIRQAIKEASVNPQK